jgi:hypothetical protein
MVLVTCKASLKFVGSSPSNARFTLRWALWSWCRSVVRSRRCWGVLNLGLFSHWLNCVQMWRSVERVLNVLVRVEWWCNCWACVWVEDVLSDNCDKLDKCGGGGIWRWVGCVSKFFSTLWQNVTKCDKGKPVVTNVWGSGGGGESRRKKPALSGQGF